MKSGRQVHEGEDDLTPEQLEEIYGALASEVGVKGMSHAAQDDRQHRRLPVADGERLDTELIDMQHGDFVASVGIGRLGGDKAARAEFLRRLRQAEA
jgi:hypothetical protein